MCEYDWLLTAHMYGLIDCLRAKLSDLSNICIQTGQIRQLSNQ